MKVDFKCVVSRIYGGLVVGRDLEGDVFIDLGQPESVFRIYFTKDQAISLVGELVAAATKPVEKPAEVPPAPEAIPAAPVPTLDEVLI